MFRIRSPELGLRDREVDEADRGGPDLVEDDAADRGAQDLLLLVPVDRVAAVVRVRDVDPVVHLRGAVGLDEEDLLQAGEQRDADVLRGLLAGLDRQVVGPEDDVLGGREDRLAGRGREDVRRRHHEQLALQDRLEGERHVDGHLVAVEVGVVRRADERVDADRLALDEDGLEGLDGEAVERRRAVQQHRVALGDLLEDVPDLRRALLDHLAGAAHGVHEAELLEAADDERLEEDERHLLREPALVELQLRADDDDGAAGVVDALAEEVLAEAALLALQHVREGLQRAVAGARDGAAVAAVVEEGVDGLLQHPLLVVDDDVGRLQLHQVAQAVVAVDDAAVEVVEVRGREAAALERDQRAQVRRDDRQDLEDHPLRAGPRVDEALDDLQALGAGCSRRRSSSGR